MRSTAQMMVLAAGVALSLAVSPLAAQKKDQKAPAADAAQQLIAPLVSAANEAMRSPAGTTVYTVDPAAGTVTSDPATTLAVTFTPAYLKASDNKIYAPFTATVQPGVLGAGSNLGVFVRLAPRGAQPPAPAAIPAADDKKNDRDRDKAKKKGKEAQDLASQDVSGVEYPWEDYYEITAAPTIAGGPLSFSRPFSVEAGEYDAYLAVVARDAAAATGPLKIAVHKAEVTVPNYWSPDFGLSSVFLSNKVTPLTAVPMGDEQKLKPYVIGNLELAPVLDGKFKSADEFAVFFIIYNPQLGEDKKPDVTIDFQPYKKGPVGESKFRAVEPQKLNAETLPAGFDVALGHQLVGSLNVPVSAFEAGDYRLAIKVTDNKSGKSLTHDVVFTVTGP